MPMIVCHMYEPFLCPLSNGEEQEVVLAQQELLPSSSWPHTLPDLSISCETVPASACKDW